MNAADPPPLSLPKLTETSGVFLLGENLPALQLQAHALGYAATVVDMAGSLDKNNALMRIAASLQFPDGFGHNWDALYDSLSDMSWAPAPGYVIVLDQLDDLRRHSPTDYAILLDILRDVAGNPAGDAAPIWFFIGLDAPRATNRSRHP